MLFFGWQYMYVSVMMALFNAKCLFPTYSPPFSKDKFLAFGQSFGGEALVPQSVLKSKQNGYDIIISHNSNIIY